MSCSASAADRGCRARHDRHERGVHRGDLDAVVSSARTSDSGRRIDSIDPPGRSFTRRPRAAIRRSASVKRDGSGEAGGAVLADTVADHRRGETPYAFHSCAIPYDITNSAGCVKRVWLRSTSR